MVNVSGQDLEIQYELVLYGVSSEAAVGNCIFRGSWLPWGGRGRGQMSYTRRGAISHNCPAGVDS